MPRLPLLGFHTPEPLAELGSLRSRVPVSKAPAHRSVASCGFGLKKAGEGKAEGREVGMTRQRWGRSPTGQQSWTLSATEAGF